VPENKSVPILVVLVATPVCRDPDDDELLALALAAQVELIVSGDDDLLDLHSFEGVAIVTPAEALRRVEAQK
jgi:predicted nucleic acid-binding protein